MRTTQTFRSARSSIVALAAFAAFATALVACTPPPGGGSGTTTTTAPTNFRQCPTRGAGQVRVAIVVDASALGSGSPSVVCVVVASGSTGVAALAARAARLGTPSPRYNSSGLLCGIDGAPAAPACGVPSGSGFNYWSYWVGGSSWTYSTVGPASRAMVDGTVEGWRFVAGGSNVAPAASPSFATLTS